MKGRMHTGELYMLGDEEILKEQALCLERLYDFNATKSSEAAKRQALKQEMFAEIGSDCYIEPPFHSNFGCRYCYFGNKIYATFNLTLVDDTHIYVGDQTIFGPNVTIATAGHLLLPELRSLGYQYNMLVRIGKNCWIGAALVILPGITIGDNVIIGTGTVVTKDLPSDVIAVGNPCKALHKIGEKDKIYYFKERRIPDAIWAEAERYKKQNL